MGEAAQADPITQAHAVFEREVYVPAFVEKCAELGVNLSDEESLIAALDTVRHVKTAMAAQSVDLVKQAHSDLRAAVGEPRPEEIDAERKAAEAATKTAKQDTLRTAFATLAGAAAQA